MSVVVQPWVQNGMFGSGIFRKVKISAPNMASGTEPARITKGSRKLLNWAASTRNIRITARAKAGRNLLPSVRSWRDSPGVVEDIALGQNLGRLRPPGTASASSSGRMATPLILTAFNCWKRFRERGTTESRRVAMVLSGISLPLGPVT